MAPRPSNPASPEGREASPNHGASLSMTAKHGSMALALVATIVLAGCGAKPSSNPPVAASSHSPSPQATPGTLDPLTGEPSPYHGPLLAVMVENSEAARPQWGLRSADVVYEAYT